MTSTLSSVIAHDDGPARVVGGFGTGKSTALRERTARLRADGARVLELRPPSFPSFATDVLARAGGGPVRLLDASEQRDMVASLVPDGLRAMAGEVAGTVLAYQASFLGAEELFVHADAAGCFDVAEELDRLTQSYLAHLESLGAVDVAGALVQASLLLRDPDVLAAERARFDFLVVDDFQLATFAVNRLLSQLAGPGGNVMVAGNEDACVGSEHGVTSRYLDGFARRFGAVLDVTVEERFRPVVSPDVVHALPGGDYHVIGRAHVESAIGEEWPAVAVVGVTEGEWPAPPPTYAWFDRDVFAGPDVRADDERAAAWLDEERRRLAIAYSRATERLVVIRER